jgi:Rieske Fe-S protein
VWPVGVAVGVAAILLGLLVSWWIVAAGAVAVIVFGIGWIYDATRTRRPEPEPTPPAPGEQVARASVGETPASRKTFLSGITLGLGAVIGVLVTVPSLIFAGVPPFEEGEGFFNIKVDLGPLGNFKEGEWLITKFNILPSKGDVYDRTAFVRYNGLLGHAPSFTIISNRCVHLGCPVQANGPVGQTIRTFKVGNQRVSTVPVLPAGFGCPCHGGQYDTEGNRVAGPPVRALDRYAYEVRGGHLILVGTYSVNAVEGTGKDANIGKYRAAQPGVHVDGVEQILYPFIPPS